MKGYFFSQLQKDNYGPQKKVRAQIKAFEKAGFEMELVENPFDDYSFFRKNFYVRQIISRLPFTYVYSKHIWKDEFKDADFYYIRCMLGDRYFTKFLKELRKNNKTAKIILEFADFPATFFMTVSALYRLIYFPDIIKDCISHKQYYKYIDRIAMLEERQEVYKIPVIRFMNGINIDEIRVKKMSGIDRIKMIAVAAMKAFHGYDRLIISLGKYYKAGGKYPIELHLVGGSDKNDNEIPKYKKMVEQFELDNVVFFYGTLTGTDLDDIYDMCNIAVSSLGMYRDNFYGVASSLKSREYLAKGLPIISAGAIDVINDQFQYVLDFDNDGSEIDIERIIGFFDNIYRNGEQYVIDSIRNYAEKKCDISYTMKPIIDYIQGGD